MLEHFGDINTRNRCEQLAALAQEHSVANFVEAFEFLISQVPCLVELQAIGYFMHGLKPKIRRWVRLHHLRTVSKAISLARYVEGTLYGGRQEIQFSDQKSVFSAGLIARSLEIHFLPLLLINPPFIIGIIPKFQNLNPGHTAWDQGLCRHLGEMRSRGTRHLSAQDLFDRRKNGLCFRSGQHYHPMHQCPNKQTRFLLLAEDEFINGGEIGSMEGDIEEEQEDVQCTLTDLVHLTNEILLKKETFPYSYSGG